MAEYLFKVSIDFNWMYRGDKSPVYAVAENKKEVEEYVKKYLKDGCKVKAVTLLGERLGMNMYHGKPKPEKRTAVLGGELGNRHTTAVA